MTKDSTSRYYNKNVNENIMGSSKKKNSKASLSEREATYALLGLSAELEDEDDEEMEAEEQEESNEVDFL